jgi:hypothetical protein
MIFEQQMDLLKKDNKPEWTRPSFPDVNGDTTSSYRFRNTRS